jgi:predicted DNA-binding protein YlxM (UPF0122 family)
MYPATGSATAISYGGGLMVKQIPKKDLNAAKQRFDTQRARYLYLTKLGYSQTQIANAYSISKRAVWQSLNATAVPREKKKLERYRTKYKAGKR